MVEIMKTPTTGQEQNADPLGSSAATGYDIKHPNAMIVINNQAELNYICEWNEMHGVLPPWLGKRSEYPIAASPNDGGWTDHMDRALYYIPFVEFIKAVS